MMILAYCIFIGLLSSTSGQKVVISLSNGYVNKPGTVTINCTVVATVISDIVEIYKDGILALRCTYPPIPCSSTIAAYSAVQDKTAGNTTMTISATDISRDTGNWTCQHGGTSSKAASLTIGTPVSITKMNELNTTAVIETSCTFPYAGVNVSCSVGGTDINCQYNISSSATCGDLNERVLTITIYLDLFKGSASGFLTVRIDNGFTVGSKTGNHTYTFTATTTTGVTIDDCALESVLGLALGVGLVNSIICIFCLIFIVSSVKFGLRLGLLLSIPIVGCIIVIAILVQKVLKRLAAPALKRLAAPVLKRLAAPGGSKFIFGLGFGIICVAYIAFIVILVKIVKPRALKEGLGFGLGLGILIVGYIIVIVFLVKKVWKKPPASGASKFIFGLVFGIICVACIVCIVILVQIGKPCALNLGPGLGLGLGIPFVFCIIVIVILVKKEVNIQDKDELHKPIPEGLEMTIKASVHAFYTPSVQWNRQDGKILTSNGKYNIEYARDTGISTLKISVLEINDSGLYTCRAISICGYSAQDSVEISVYENRKIKSGPRTSHFGTENNVESETTSKKTNDGLQPLLHATVITDGIPKHCPQPTSPENSDVEDRNLRGIHVPVNFDDSQDLPTDILQFSSLPPLTQKQPTVEEEDASENPKQKQNKKKKGKVNEGNPEEMVELNGKRKLPEDQSGEE